MQTRRWVISADRREYSLKHLFLPYWRPLWIAFGIGLVALPTSAAKGNQDSSPAVTQITAFWKSTRERLAAEPMDAKVELLQEPLPYRKYRVTLRGLDGIPFRAYLAVPVRGESSSKLRLPAIVTSRLRWDTTGCTTERVSARLRHPSGVPAFSGRIGATLED